MYLFHKSNKAATEFYNMIQNLQYNSSQEQEDCFN